MGGDGAHHWRADDKQRLGAVDGLAGIRDDRVAASRQAASIEGIVTAEQAPKARSTITQDYIATQQAGQTILETLNLTPGLNFVNNGPEGGSGGDIRLRGFDNNRISLMQDGVPLNGTGNYAIYSNQQLDPELISQASVNIGTSDVDGPTASATHWPDFRPDRPPRPSVVAIRRSDGGVVGA